MQLMNGIVWFRCTLKMKKNLKKFTHLYRRVEDLTKLFNFLIQPNLDLYSITAFKTSNLLIFRYVDYNCYKCKQTLYGIMIHYVQQGELQSPLMLRAWQYTCFGGPNRWQRAGKWRWIANFITKSLAWKQSFHYNVHWLM